MIKCLIIGTQNSVESYSKKLEDIRFFSHIEKHIIDDNNPLIPFINFKKYDALVFTENPPQIKPFIESAIREQSNIYFTDQSWMDADICAKWLKINAEANNLFYIEIPELQHPMTEDFLKSYNHHSLIKIHKNVKSQYELRETLLNAVSFITIKNPMQVKKIDVNSMDTSPKGKPVTKIRLKMYDHSYGYIILTKDNNNEHILRFEDKRESFIFNFTNAYLENSSGVRFKCDNPTTEQLKSSSLESFALHIIHNNKPAFCLTHYLLVLKILHKVEVIIIQNF